VSLLPGVIRRCRKLAHRVGISSSGLSRSIRAVERVLDDAGRSLFTDSGVPGLSVVVHFAEGATVRRDFGYADLASRKPIDESTRFQALSMSKPLTAMTILALIDRGQIDLDQPVLEIDPTLPIASIDPSRPELDPAPITLRQVLCHSACFSVPRHPWTAPSDFRYGAETLATQEEHLKVRVQEPPGTNIIYSGGGYVVVQALIERLTGLSLMQAARKLVLDPLGLTESGIELDGQNLANLATRHDDANRPLPPARTIAPGSSGYTTTSLDLARLWAMVLDSEDGPRGRGVISPELAEAMVTPQCRAPDGRMTGLAFFLWQKRSDTEFFHSGYADGWWGHAEGLHNRKVVYTLLSNGQRGMTCIKPLTTKIRQCLYDTAL
jgi:CubicO group peptidase (beta-lactamase class C family)